MYRVNSFDFECFGMDGSPWMARAGEGLVS